ncbi:MAG: hypothetical protein EYC69_01245 [Bacteroidetes bacterium]|nr:MAG: hypothetical protein EYC69_01245 [Bacteroidota bacterium]
MTTLLKSLFTVIAFTFSFLSVNAIEFPPTLKTGVFGVCDCQAKSDKPKIIELTINEDFTFDYIDNSDPKNKLILTGKWTAKGSRIYLNSSDNRKTFHRKWKYVAGEKCIKSRYQLNFKRICLAAAC